VSHPAPPRGARSEDVTGLPLVDAAGVEHGRGVGHLALADAARTLASGADSDGLAVAGGGAVYAWPHSPFSQALGVGWCEEPPEPALATLEAPSTVGTARRA
jgi:hypothetical protein